MYSFLYTTLICLITTIDTKSIMGADKRLRQDEIHYIEVAFERAKREADDTFNA